MNLTEFAIRTVAWGGYWGIFFLMALENIVPPVPSEIIMGLGGMAVARGQMEFGLLMLAGTAGSVAGNWVWYEIGRRVGHDRMKPLVDRWGRWLTMEWEDVEKLHRFFRRRGGITVFVFRFLPFGRTIISIPAGMLGMPLGRFLLYTAGGSAIWNAILVAAGYYLGRNFGELDKVMGPLAVVIVAAAILWYVWRVMTWHKGRGGA